MVGEDLPATMNRWIGSCGGSALLDAIASERHMPCTSSTLPPPGTAPTTATVEARLVWIGEDQRGVELEIVALDLPDGVVVHVMPTRLRRPGD
jgi:hypothetical protein